MQPTRSPKRYLAHLNFIFHTNRVHIGAVYTQWYEPTFSGMTALAGKFFQAAILVLGPLAVLLACLAIVQAARSDRRKLAFILPAASYLITTIIPMQYMNLRYAMPVVFILDVFAGRGIAFGLTFVNRSKLAMGSVIALTLAWPLFLSFDLTVRMRTDSRYQAEEWLTENIRRNAKAGYFGSVNALPSLRADVQLTSLPSGTAALDYLRKQGPEFLIMVPDWTSAPGMRHSKFCPDDLYERLNDGSLGYTLTKAFEPQYVFNQQLLDYPSVSPPVQIFARTDSQAVGLQQ